MGKKLDLKVGGRNSSPVVARVTVLKRKVVPPNSVVQLPCKMDATLSDDYVVEAVDGLKVLVPRVVRAGGTEPIVCMVNVSDQYLLLRAGQQVGEASPVDGYCEPQEEVQIQTVECEEGSPDELSDKERDHDVVPEHLQKLF